jgi:hypothetical protein
MSRHGGIRRRGSADRVGRLEEEGWRYGQAQRLGGLEVDDELKRGSLCSTGKSAGLAPLRISRSIAFSGKAGIRSSKAS